jgi:hypothetical protein
VLLASALILSLQTKSTNLGIRAENACLTDGRPAAIIEVSTAHNIRAEQGFAMARRPVEMPTVCFY